MCGNVKEMQKFLCCYFSDSTMKPEQERVRNLIADTVTLLCRNGLQFQKEMKIQGLLGITLDNSDVFLVQIDEKVANVYESVSATVNNANSESNSAVVSHDEQHRSKRIHPIGASRSLVTRPIRPQSRFGRLSKATQRPKRPRTIEHNLGPSSTPNTTQPYAKRTFMTSDLQYSGSSLLQSDQGINNSNIAIDSRSDNLQVIKTEEDADLIIIDKDSDSMSDEKQAMLGAYMAEVSGSEATMAQNAFSEFSVITANTSMVDNKNAGMQQRDLDSEGFAPAAVRGRSYAHQVHVPGDVDGKDGARFSSSPQMDSQDQQWAFVPYDGLSPPSFSGVQSSSVPVSMAFLFISSNAPCLCDSDVL